MSDKQRDVITSLRKIIVDLEHRHKVEAALKAEEYKTEIGRIAKTYESKLNFLKSDPNALCGGADVQFLLDNGEKLRGHRFVLAAKSPRFKEIFQKHDTGKNSTLYSIKGTSFAIMTAVIRFCHTGDITFTEEVTARKVLEVAHIYQIDYLEEVCMEELIRRPYKESIQDTSSPIFCAVIGFCTKGEINFTDEITPLQVLKIAHDHKISTLEEVCLKEHMKTRSSKDVTQASSLSKSPCSDEKEASRENKEEENKEEEEEEEKETSSEDEEEESKEEEEEEDDEKEKKEDKDEEEEETEAEEEEESNEEPVHNRSGSGASETDESDIGPKITKRTQRGNLEEQGKRLSKKVKIEASIDSGSENGSVGSDAEPNALSNFNISEPLRKPLKARGIETLLPIQAATFKSILAGNDVVARVSPCQRTTLCFALPILESLQKSGRNDKRPGRAPSVIVLTPTLDMAVQLRSDFNFYGDPLGLETLLIQGGANNVRHAELTLSSGVDIVIGTPERFRLMKDDNIDLNLKTLMFLVLDNLYWNKGVEAIVKEVQDGSRVQTLLFGERFYVKNIVERFMNPGKTMMHIVRDEKKASGNVKHYFMPCRYQTRTLLSADRIGDTISCYGKVDSMLYSPEALKLLESLDFTAPRVPLGVQPVQNTAKN